jgi:hypothetical protein
MLVVSQANPKVTLGVINKSLTLLHASLLEAQRNGNEWRNPHRTFQKSFENDETVPNIPANQIIEFT